MSSQVRWKLLCGVLAAATLYSWVRPSGSPVPVAAAEKRTTVYRPVRVSAAALGVSQSDLVERLLASRNTTEMRALAEKLGVVGDDAAIDAVRPLLTDPRPGVPEMIVSAIGHIGTDHAVELLVQLTDDPRSDVRWTAIIALGESGNERAEKFLVAEAKRGDTTAINALGTLASDHAAEVLYKIASVGSGDSATAAINALGAMDTPAAQQAIARLIDSPSTEIAAKAIAAVQTVDDALLAKLTKIAKSDEPVLARPALMAIAHSGDEAVPLLREVAESSGSAETRVAAVQALGRVASEAAVPTLTALVETADAELAIEAARSLANVDTDEARDALISAALSDRAEATRAVDALLMMQSTEIEPALLEIAKAEQYGAERALERLLQKGNADAVQLVLARAGSSNAETRFRAISLLAQSPGDAHADQLIALVRAESDADTKARTLDLLATSRPGDPRVTEVLRESLRRGGAESRAAAVALGRIGTDEARDALVSVLAGSDEELAYTAMGALATYRLTDEIATALESAASRHPSIAPEVMRKLLASGSPAGLRMAENAINSSDGHQARAALRALAESGAPQAVELILRATRASNEDVRATAIRSLGNARGNDKALDAIAAATRDSSSGVRETAASMLSSDGSPRAQAALIEMSRNPDPSDRIMALQYMQDTPETARRSRELMRDPNTSVAYYAMRNLVAGSEGTATIRAFVLDGSAKYDMRYDAARMLESYGKLDDATRAWLEQARAAEYAYYE